ncbi:ATP-binding cassette domain-containing protein [Nonomuraea sp. NPDC000554]|uniref:ATP-binding cassette domain-containing protein n=1 Tax=Nonomuraea sp. NPDC000554 TaxID=3154259 RepID=UPI00333173B7
MPIGWLSTGQQQRLALARLLSEPSDVPLLDEPTNHLSLALVRGPGGRSGRLRRHSHGQPRSPAVSALAGGPSGRACDFGFPRHGMSFKLQEGNDS